MISFFIDTALSPATLAILSNEKILEWTQVLNNHDLSENLLAHIDDLFKKSNLKIEEIDKIIVGIGPGSFTGIRIGVTIAKTMAYTLKIPIIPVSSLELLATTQTNTEYIVPLIDARRNYVYGAIYKKDLNCSLNDTYITLEELKNKLPNEEQITYISYDNLPLANIKKPEVQIEKIVSKHKNDTPCNPHQCNPIYLKRTEAEENHD